MTYSQLRHWVQSSNESVLEALTTRQFVSPHRPLGDVLGQTLDELRVSRQTGRTVLARLELDPTIAIGRLKRCQLTQLARVIQREWRAASKE